MSVYINVCMCTSVPVCCARGKVDRVEYPIEFTREEFNGEEPLRGESVDRRLKNIIFQFPGAL